MDFSDSEHELAELVFQGADEYPPEARCDAVALSALRAWQGREQKNAPAAEHFQLEGFEGFSITYDGASSDYWPDSERNWLRESLVREFLFAKGVCDLAGLKPRVFELRFKVQALQETEYLLVCPYATDAGNIAGIVVVCIDHHLA